MTLTVHPLPLASAGPDQEICIGDTTQLAASGGMDYAWTPNVNLSDSALADPLAWPFITTNYIVEVTDSNTCVNSDTMMLTVHSLPLADAGLDTEICIGDSTQLQATGGVMYVWTPATGLSNDSIDDPMAGPVDTTLYFVLVTDSNTCQQIDSIEVVVNPLDRILPSAVATPPAKRFLA